MSYTICKVSECKHNGSRGCRYNGVVILDTLGFGKHYKNFSIKCDKFEVSSNYSDRRIEKCG